VLLKHTPILKRLAYTDSPFQGMAAGLAARAKIMQIMIATNRLDFVGCERVCADAVRFGALSGNHMLLAVALDWQGNTYTNFYHQPQTAIIHLNDALSNLNSESPSLTRSAIYSDLSNAYAQEGNEGEARKYIELAHMVMPDYPELDPFYQLNAMSKSELYQFDGRVYLYLAKHFPDSDYAQLALDIVEQSASMQPMNPYYESGSLIKKADALRALGDMRGCMACLTDGFTIAGKVGIIKKMSEASGVIGDMPQEWKQEAAVQKLQKDITHAILALQ
jgi:tetratricopeptide (TPR) repeat protein